MNSIFEKNANTWSGLVKCLEDSSYLKALWELDMFFKQKNNRYTHDLIMTEVVGEKCYYVTYSIQYYDDLDRVRQRLGDEFGGIFRYITVNQLLIFIEHLPVCNEPTIYVNDFDELVAGSLEVDL